MWLMLRTMGTLSKMLFERSDTFKTWCKSTAGD